MVAHIRQLEHEQRPRAGDPAEWNIRPALIVRPLNDKHVMEYIDTLMPDRNLRVKSKRDLLVDLCRRTDTGEGIVHLFNVSWAKRKAANAEVHDQVCIDIPPEF